MGDLITMYCRDHESLVRTVKGLTILHAIVIGLEVLILMAVV